MKNNEQRLCIICETDDKQSKAEYFPKFNGDRIPLCRKHYKIFKIEHLEEILEDEQSDK